MVDRGFSRLCQRYDSSLGWRLLCHHFLMVDVSFQPKKLTNPDASQRFAGLLKAANRRLKQFKYFANIIQNSSLKYLESDMSIACALINRYQPSIARSKLEHEEIGAQIMKLREQKNKMQMVNKYENYIS